MNKVTTETAAKMMMLGDRSTYQGRITHLAIAFLSQTGLGFGELARLKVRDVYQLGIVYIYDRRNLAVVRLNRPRSSPSLAQPPRVCSSSPPRLGAGR